MGRATPPPERRLCRTRWATWPPATAHHEGKQRSLPDADRVKRGEKKGEVVEAFERVEHEEPGEGVHEKYLGMAEALEREARA